jgi:hypothetical protein
MSAGSNPRLVKIYYAVFQSVLNTQWAERMDNKLFLQNVFYNFHHVDRQYPLFSGENDFNAIIQFYIFAEPQNYLDFF